MTYWTRRGLMRTGAAAGISLAAAPLVAQETTERIIETMAVGDEAAPVQVVEYASLTCPHCARFHIEVYGRLKSEFIDTGKMRLELRDVYFDRYGLWAAMVARCGGRERYFGIIDRLYAKQAEWSRHEDSSDAVRAIMAVGRQAGLTDDEMGACLQDNAWAKALLAEYQKNAEADGVRSTPTFIINGAMQPNMGFEEFAEKIEAALAG